MSVSVLQRQLITNLKYGITNPSNGATSTGTTTVAVGVDSIGKVYVANAIGSLDSRYTDYSPTDRAAGLYSDFKRNDANGLSDGGMYNGVLTFRPYGYATDISGGAISQLGFTNNGNLWIRSGSGAATWNTWKQILDSGSGWSTKGNSGTLAGTNFIGTTDAQDLVIRTNNMERLRITSSGSIGIGMSAPNAKLDIQNNGANAISAIFNANADGVTVPNVA
jgi:hypothetical protein